METDATVKATDLHDDRLLPADPQVRAIARELYDQVRDLPLVCPHGHVAADLLADDEPFPDPAQLLIVPDHYVHRMLHSVGIPLSDLGIPRVDGPTPPVDPREVWRKFCEHWHLYRATPTRLWIEQELVEVFDVMTPMSAKNADAVYDELSDRLADPKYSPRALFDRFNIEVLATTDDATDDLAAHARIRDDADWDARIVPTFRPDRAIDPDKPGFAATVERLGEMTNRDSHRYPEYLAALSDRRQAFIAMGATATDHGHPTAFTGEVDANEAQRLLTKALAGTCDAQEAERFRGHMLVQMARMSVEDGMVMQLHAGSFRDHDPHMLARYGVDMGADIPQPTNYVHGLKALLDELGTEPRLTLVLFTLDESTYSRELAPLAGYYPALKLGPPWWFYDSPHGMRRYREAVTETAGFYNTAGFNDDTRAFPSIPVRHDVARRMDCGYLAQLVAEHRLPLDEAHETAADLAYHLAKRTYRL